jgi:hypothetical protein
MKELETMDVANLRQLIEMGKLLQEAKGEKKELKDVEKDVKENNPMQQLAEAGV